jgi:lipocalin
LYEEGFNSEYTTFSPITLWILHPNSKTNSEILDAIIKEAKNQGYEFKVLDQFK